MVLVEIMTSTSSHTPKSLLVLLGGVMVLPPMTRNVTCAAMRASAAARWEESRAISRCRWVSASHATVMFQEVKRSRPPSNSRGTSTTCGTSSHPVDRCDHC